MCRTRNAVAEHLGKPLTRVPDPFGTHPSFGEHNNARLRAFLDTFGFDYEFLSSTECYTSGRFDEALLQVLSNFDKVMAIMLPSLREERAQTYSPFLPISPTTGIVLQVPVIAHDAKAGTITYEDPDTKQQHHDAGHRRALQAAMEAGLGDALDRARRRLRDGRQGPDRFGEAVGRDQSRHRRPPPEGFNYELFLDEKGQKISKSKGNGLTIDEWLRYASAGIAVAVHVSRAEGGEAALFRCDPAQCRRVSAIPRRLSAPGRQAAALQSGLAYPFRQSAEGRHADHRSSCC